VRSYKLQETARHFHDWTRSEKQGLKKAHVGATVAAAATWDDEKKQLPDCAEKPDAESSDGEMDNFQTPLVRRLNYRPYV